MQNQSELRQAITNTIIDALSDGGLPPWRRPWADDKNAPGLHTSLSSGQSYRGVNQILLMVAAMKSGFKSKWWGTFRQVAFNGASVEKGQKATKVILWKPIQRKRSNEQGKEVEDSYLVMREFAVFNVEQTNGLDQFRVGLAKPDAAEQRYEHADKVIAATGASLQYGGNKAFYNILGDFIQLPHRHQFDSTEAFLETAFHELCHWAEKRVGFDRSQAENTYALGELAAEIGSCLTMAELNLPTATANHAAYLKTWLDGMAGDSRFIFRAAAQASKTVDHILSYSRTPAVEEPVLA